MNWHPTAAEVAAIVASKPPTKAGQWDTASVLEREQLNPNLNPRKRWYEQPEHAAVVFQP